EGGPSRTDESRPFAPVAAHLAISTGCPIIPAYIDGIREVLKEEEAVPSPAPVKITFGLPLYPPLPGSGINASRDLNRRLKLAIEPLKPTSEAGSAGESR